MICTAKRYSREICSIALSVVLLVFVALTGVQYGHAQPNADDHSGQWEVHAPGGETSCADGSEFKYYTRKGSPDQLLVYFSGGGACWTGKQCDTETDPTPYAYNLANNDPRLINGIFNLTHPDNPLADYTMVYVPTCTGDVGLGDSVATYRYHVEGGAEKTVTVNYKGYQNSRSALSWVYDNVKNPETVVVSGSSAGGLAAPFYANIVAGHYPQARVVGIGDAAGAYRKSATEKADLSGWNMEKLYQNHDAFSSLSSQNIGIEKLYISAVNRQVKNLELYQVDQAYDSAQRFFLTQAGTENPNVSALIQKNRRDIRNSYPEFRSFMVGGREHTVLNSSLFYSYKSNGILFRDWMKEVLEGNSVTSVQCENCERPEFRYTAADGRIIEKMQNLLSGQDQWNPEDDFQNNRDCSGSGETYSLRCSVVEATKGEEGEPNDFPVTYLILYEIRDRLGAYNANDMIIVEFNNQNGRTFQDIKNLIEHVEDEIETQLEK